MKKLGSPSVGIVSLGCPKNLVDTEVMLGHLKKDGFALTDPEKSRVVIVNTCGFIDRAKEESVDGDPPRGARGRKTGEIDRVVVAGCMVQKYGRRAGRGDPRGGPLPRARRAGAGAGGRARPPVAPALRAEAARHAPLRRARARGS